MSRVDLSRIMARCIEDGDCLIWTGKTNGKGQPMTQECVNGESRSVTVRRRAYEEYHKVKLNPDQQVTTCGHPGCLAKAHLEVISRSEKARRMNAALPADTRLKRSRKQAAALQRKKGKFTPELVRAVLESPDGPYVTAKRLGVSGVVASRIKRGLSYRDFAASPFSGLGARNA